MEDQRRSRCDSLNAGYGFEKELLSPGSHINFDPEGCDPLINYEPTPAEVAQCEAEVGTLLSIIAELNKKMGNLKAPSEPGDLSSMRASVPSRPLVPDLLSHRLDRSSQERSSSVTSKPQGTDWGGTGRVWTKLQEVLSSVEDSISCRRTWVAPIRASDLDKRDEHIRAAQENWTKATQMLEEMEREFGISCPLSLANNQHPDDTMDSERQESGPRNIFQSHLENLQRSQSAASLVEEEKNKLVCLHKAWKSGSNPPPYRPTAGAQSPDWASPPYPGSPLILRRTKRAITPLSVGGEASPMGSINSGSPCASPISQESETERLHRYIERLKVRNERLTSALERKKVESEQNTQTLAKLEADCSALQMALRYCEESEEAYSQLLSLYDAQRQQNIHLWTEPAETVGDRHQGDSPSAQLRKMGTEELSTSFSSAGTTEETQTQSHTGQREPETKGREVFLREQIERLKRDRAAICLRKPCPVVQGKPSAETNQLAGTKGGPATKDGSKPPETKREKASLFYELISVREEMSDLRALIRLKEKELRCLEWGLVSQKAKEATGVFIPESLREERLLENAAKVACEGDIANISTRPILKELQVVLQREQALKKRLALVQDSLGPALSDGASSHRKDNGEQIARLTQAHSKALSSYRQIRRKYREQVWRLEQKVAAMMDSQNSQGGATKAAEEAVEWRREETVL
ncbi:colorectal mutant cancer protein isoform 2-T2 [Menidia menidia]